MKARENLLLVSEEGILNSNSEPYPDFNGSLREGDNLFTSSVVALDASSGEMSCYYQTVHHDIWDYDGTNPVILFDVELVFLYPWAVVYRTLGMVGLVEMGVFLGILMVGFIYAWDNGALNWQ